MSNVNRMFMMIMVMIGEEPEIFCVNHMCCALLSIDRLPPYPIDIEHPLRARAGGGISPVSFSPS